MLIFFVFNYFNIVVLWIKNIDIKKMKKKNFKIILLNYICYNFYSDVVMKSDR